MDLLKNEMIVPELLQYDCNPVELSRIIIDLVTDSDVFQRMQTRLYHLKISLSAQQADCTIGTLVENEILR